MILTVKENTDGVMRVLDWLKRCVDGGSYDDLRGFRFRAENNISVMQAAASTMGVNILFELTKDALGRIAVDGLQLDASNTVRE